MKRHKDIFECKYGDILALEVINKNGVTIVAANTAINGYIKEKLIHIGVRDVFVYEFENEKRNSVDNDKFNQFKKNYENNVAALRETIHDLATGKNLNDRRIQDISDSLYQEMKETKHMIKCLNDIKNTDHYTYRHSINVAFYAMLIGKWLKLSKCEIQDLIKAALLHDIGKIKVCNEILNKKGRLQPEEFEEIKKHTIYGYDILQGIAGLSEDIKRAVLMHHEREDHSGYPMGIKGDEIDKYSKIVAVADVYDAMTSDRVYKKRATPFEAFKMFETEGMHIFDVKIIRTFLTNLAPYFTGSKVLLNTGALGELVYIPPHNITKPIIRIGFEYVDTSERKDLRIASML
ncbi:MAG: HD-GYP domain-containing protein [Bacillota bacterium]